MLLLLLLWKRHKNLLDKDDRGAAFWLWSHRGLFVLLSQSWMDSALAAIARMQRVIVLPIIDNVEVVVKSVMEICNRPRLETEQHHSAGTSCRVGESSRMSPRLTRKTF